MSFISKSELIAPLSRATNSSHFVWLIADLEFYRTRKNLIFAFKRRGRMVFLALEPLGILGEDRHQAFAEAWREFRAGSRV